MSTQGTKLKAIADAIRSKDNTTAAIPANTFADRILALPVGIENPSVTLPAASTQEEQLARIAEAIRAKEGSEESIPAAEFVERILALESAKPSRLPEGYTEVEYIHLSGAVGFQTNYRATPSWVRILFDIQLEKYSGVAEYFFYQVGTIGQSTVNYYLFLLRSQIAKFRLAQGVRSEKYTDFATRHEIIGRITIDVNIPSKMLTIGDFNTTFSAGTTYTFKNNYLYIGCGSSTSRAPASNLYSCKIYVRGRLKFDFVPCKNDSGVSGLFDLVANKFYSNSFDGIVTAGPAV